MPRVPGKDVSDASKVEGLSFESALREVEAIIERIEGGEVGLEQSLADYERGIRLIAQCKGRLEQAQQRVIDLTKKLAQVDNEADQGREAAGSSDDAEEEPEEESPF